MSRNRDRITRLNRSNERARQWREERREERKTRRARVVYERDRKIGSLPPNLR